MSNGDDISVSVILPVYNGGKHLYESLGSILSQTYSDFEVIIINDGSTDDSVSVIQKFKDPRIRYHEQSNQGLAATLNRGIGLSRGRYLARQDQDDISLPKRFEKQVDFLESHPSHGMVGTWAKIKGQDENIYRAHRHPADSLRLKFELLFNNPFVHSSVMIRKNVFKKVGGYSTNTLRQPPEDYELWSRVAREFKVANIPEILHVYREVPGSMSRDGINPFLERVMNISAENLAWTTGRQKEDRDIRDYIALIHGAHYRLSPRPDREGISKLLYEAADHLSDSAHADRDILREVVHARLQSIVRPCLQHRYGKIMCRVLERFYKPKELTR